MEETIKVSGLSKSYAGNQIIKNLTFAVKAGEVYGLLGANGAGKTTTIECMLGTRKADTGSVSILGLDPWRNRKQLFEQVGVQFQEASYSDKIKVKELCEETACLYRSVANYGELLRRFDLWEKKDSFVNELSGGQKQRLFIVLALLPDPKVVFLDELTTGLDTKARRSVWKSLITLKEKGLTIFLSSHFMDEVETLCDTIAILKEGNFIFTGTVQEAIDRSPHDSLEEAYLWFTGEEEMDNE
jgi:ABC-2 type transport system ATP-binding protein|nr:ABC transporter ATP-binding protein [uncultured Schaedlerella sp.]